METRYPALDKTQYHLKLSVNASLFANDEAACLRRDIRDLRTRFSLIAANLNQLHQRVDRTLALSTELDRKTALVLERRSDHDEREQKEMNLCVFGAFDEAVENWRVERGMDDGRGGKSGIIDGRFMFVDDWGRREEGVFYDLMEVMGGTVKSGEVLVVRHLIRGKNYTRVFGRNERWKKYAPKEFSDTEDVDTSFLTYPPSMPELVEDESNVFTIENVNRLNQYTRADDSASSNPAIPPLSEASQTAPTQSSSLITADSHQSSPSSSLASQPTTSFVEPKQALQKSFPSASTTDSNQPSFSFLPPAPTALQPRPANPAPPSLLVITPTKLLTRIYILNTYEAYVKAYRKTHNDEDPPFNIRYDRTHARHFDMKLTKESRAENWRARKADKKRREALGIEKEDRKGTMWLG